MKEEDINRIAAIEQAIAKKYGPETIKNPKSLWSDEKERDYLLQLKKEAYRHRKQREKSEKTEVQGFSVPRKILEREDNTRWCPICDTYSFNIKDDVYMNKFRCCFKCYVLFIEGRREKIEKISGIYQIKNVKDSTYYVGSSNDIEISLYKHKWNLRNKEHTNKQLQDMWNKHGEKFFVFETLEKVSCETNILLEREQYFLNLLGAVKI